MLILDNAKLKIETFNNNPKYRGREDYCCILLARGQEKSLVDKDGNISAESLELLDKVLRGYFRMNRLNAMGNPREFVSKLREKFANRELGSILAKLRDVTIMSNNLEEYKADIEKLYESLSNPVDGLSSNNRRFCVGTTKLVHCLYPELFVMVDSTVGCVVLNLKHGQYNNFSSYWKVLKRCNNELGEWQRLCGSTDDLLRLDSGPTTLTRIFDKCCWSLREKDISLCH